MADEQAFLERCEEIRRLAFSFSEPLIVHHYDADGVSSGAIAAGAFISAGRPFRRECIRKLDDAAIERYAKEKEIIFTDLGGGNRRVNELHDVVVIDHHQTEGIAKPQANPLLFGIDGGDELSASGTAYCVFREYPELAVVGAVGDMQHPLKGMNRWVLGEGEKTGRVRAEEDVSLYGRYCRPLVQFVAYSDDPYLPGLSFREDKAMELLAELRIPLEDGGRKRAYADLGADEKRALVSALVKALIATGKTGIMEESYVFPQRPRDETYEANEFSTLLNACGRHGKPDIGVKVCLGDAGAYAEARSLLQLHRKMLREGIAFANARIQDLGPFRLIDARGAVDEGIIGIVCGMLHSQKAVIGVSEGENGTLKVSGRAPRALVEKGVNLGELMKKAVAETGGAGGGHRMAAGASLPPGSLNSFLLSAGGYLKRFSDA
jgi:single-stranded-DNA-specific exonuclease